MSHEIDTFGFAFDHQDQAELLFEKVGIAGTPPDVTSSLHTMLCFIQLVSTTSREGRVPASDDDDCYDVETKFGIGSWPECPDTSRDKAATALSTYNWFGEAACLPSTTISSDMSPTSCNCLLFCALNSHTLLVLRPLEDRSRSRRCHSDIGYVHASKVGECYREFSHDACCEVPLDRSASVDGA